MTTMSRFSPQNVAGLRSLHVVLRENPVLVLVLVLDSKGPYCSGWWEDQCFFFLSLFIYVFPFLETRLIDMELHYPFLYFSLDDILLLISCILTQQRIVFLSSSYSLLTPIIEVCILSYIWILLGYLHNIF